jgi:hypothetical protein
MICVVIEKNESEYIGEAIQVFSISDIVLTNSYL